METAASRRASSVVQITGAVGGLADVAVADLDGDGALDVVATNPGSRLVAMVTGDGLGDLRAGPTLMLGAPPAVVLLADVTGDGHPDALVATDTGVVVLRGVGDGELRGLKTIATQSPVADLGAGRSRRRRPCRSHRGAAGTESE